VVEITAYINTLLRQEGRKVGAALVLMLGLGCLEGVGLLLLLPMLTLLGITATPGASHSVTALVSSLVQTLGIPLRLEAILGVYLLIIGVHALLVRTQTLLTLNLQHSFTTALRQHLYAALSHASWLFISRLKASEITQVLTADVERIGQGTHALLRLASTGSLMLVYVALAVRLSPAMTAIVLACGAGLALALRQQHRRTQALGQTFSSARNALYSVVLEHLGGMKVAKSYNAIPQHLAQFNTVTRALYEQFMQFGRTMAATKMIFDIGAAVALSALCYVAITFLHVPATDLLLLIFLCARLLPQYSGMQQSYQQVLHMLPAFTAAMTLRQRCLTAVEPLQADGQQPGPCSSWEPRLSVFSLPLRRGRERVGVKAREEGVEGPEGRGQNRELPSPARQPVTVDTAIVCHRLWFRYEQTATSWVLRNLTCTIAARQTTAIVGPSGAGKSTLADCLMGLLVPEQGTVLVDGIPLHVYGITAWRQRIGYVPQETFVFHDTVRANLLWARPEASEPELLQALRLAAAEEFVASLPQGPDTVLGDRGVRLSGGERQRLALARALVRRPALLLLDEATSALDLANEQRIHQALSALHGQLTIVLIAHRLSTVRMADHILVLEAGQMVETGTWDELWGRPGSRFRALVQGAWQESSEELSCKDTK
jgi:ATP-binding cassette subfamily C protein